MNDARTKVLADALGDVPGPLTWNDLANDYLAMRPGSRVHTFPFPVLFSWARHRPDKYIIDDDGRVYRART